jgi:hypothetical protein
MPNLSTTDIEQLAYKIADEAAESAIECNCNIVAAVIGRDRIEWSNLASTSSEAREAMQRDAKYLELRGRLVRHALNPDLVRVVEAV